MIKYSEIDQYVFKISDYGFITRNDYDGYIGGTGYYMHIDKLNSYGNMMKS
jgi:hypothetical protein